MDAPEKRMIDSEELIERMRPYFKEHENMTAAMTDEEFEAYASKYVTKDPLTPQKRAELIREGRLYIDYIDIPEKPVESI